MQLTEQSFKDFQFDATDFVNKAFEKCQGHDGVKRSAGQVCQRVLKKAIFVKESKPDSVQGDKYFWKENSPIGVKTQRKGGGKRNRDMK
jgi:hypothetical protein